MSIRKSLIESIKSEEIKNISSDIGEVIIDSTLEDGILKDIPIIGTLININKGRLSIQDRIFSRKILSFLYHLKDISEKERIEIIDKIESSEKEKIKVGEKVLYLIDKSDDHIKAGMIGILFAELIKENLNYEEFKRCSEIINKTYLDDLFWFIESDVVELSMEESSDLISSGLFDLPFELKFVNRGNTEKFVGDDFRIEGFDKSTVNYFAEKMRKILKGKASR